MPQIEYEHTPTLYTCHKEGCGYEFDAWPEDLAMPYAVMNREQPRAARIKCPSCYAIYSITLDTLEVIAEG